MQTYIGISCCAGLSPEFRPHDETFLAQYPRNLKRAAIAVVWDKHWRDFTLVNKFCERFPHGVVEVHLSNECARRAGERRGQWAEQMSNKEFAAVVLAKDRRIKQQVQRRVKKVRSERFFKRQDLAEVIERYLAAKKDGKAPNVFFLWSASQQGLRGARSWAHGIGPVGRQYYFDGARDFRQALITMRGE